MRRLGLERLEDRRLLSVWPDAPLVIKAPWTDADLPELCDKVPMLADAVPSETQGTNLSKTPVAPFGAAIGLNFEALNSIDSGFIPPDTMGAVGQDHIVELINGAYAVYDKLDGTRLGFSTLDVFWINAGVTPTAFAFDPRVLYDPAEDCFYACALDNPRGDNHVLFAISDDGDPRTGWTGWAVDSDSDNGQRWADFPQMSYDDDGVYVGVNTLDIPGGTSYSTERATLVLPKADLLAATPSIANRTLLEDHKSTTGGSAQGAVYPNDPTGGLPAAFIADTASSGDTLRVSKLEGPVTNPSFTHYWTFAIFQTGLENWALSCLISAISDGAQRPGRVGPCQLSWSFPRWCKTQRGISATCFPASRSGVTSLSISPG